jgi:arylsulfatase A-like enzyme
MKRFEAMARWALVPALLLITACGGREFPQRTNILLITVDTLRADHLSAYGYARQTTPVLDRLAREGVRFANATVQWPKTGPSFASIFTSTYPKDNQIVRKIGIPLPFEFRMLAEELHDLGYATHAVVANGALASDFNFHQGFDTFIETWKMEPSEQLPEPTRADGITRLAISVLEQRDRSKPFFLWVHYLDPHAPYEAPEPYRERFVGDEHYEPEPTIEIDLTHVKRDLMAIGYGQVLDGHDELGYYVARYDGEIAYNDAQIGELLEAVDSEGLTRETLVAFTSDHGESLGDHHYFFDHGRFAFQSCLWVPLILRLPGVLEPQVVEDPVELLSLSPTLLEAAGAKLREGMWMQGRSLTPRLFGQEKDGQGQAYVFSEAGYGREGLWLRVARTRRFKLIDAQEGGDQRWLTGEVGKRYALFDLEADPGESVNVFDQYEEEGRRLARLLDRWSEIPFDVLVDHSGGEETGDMDERTREQLKALGYLQ